MAMMRDRVAALYASTTLKGQFVTFNYFPRSEGKLVRTFLVAVGVAKWKVADSVVRIGVPESPNSLFNDPLEISCSRISLQTQENAWLSGLSSDLLTRSH